MFNAFSLAANDQSLVFLGQIFGNVGIVLSGTGGVLLGTMFKTFNSALLIVGVLIVAYTTIVGTIATAQEGTFLGKSFDSVWVPIRTVVGIVGLMPTSSGYCAAQVLIMWAIVQGVGAADMVWATTLKYFAAGGKLATVSVYYTDEDPLVNWVKKGGIVSIAGGPNAIDDITGGQEGHLTESGPTMQDVGNTFPKQLKELFADLVCAAAMEKVAANDVNAKPVLEFFGPNDLASQNGMSGYFFDKNKEGICGSIEWGMVSSNIEKLGLAPAMVDGQTRAMKAIVPAIAVIANYYVKQVMTTDACWNTDNSYPSLSLTKKGAGGGTSIPCDPKQTQVDQDDYCNYFNKYRSFKTNPECNWVSVPVAKSKIDQLLAYTNTNFMTEVTKMMYGYANNYIVEYNLKTGDTSATGGGFYASPEYKLAANRGWLFAGSLYYFIAQRRNAGFDQYNEFVKGILAKKPTMLSDPSSTPPQIFKTNPFIIALPSDNTPNLYDAALDIGGALIGTAKEVERSSGGMVAQSQSAMPSGAKDIWGNVGNAAADMIDTFSDLLTPGPGQDPIVRIHDFGHSLLVGAEVLFFAFLGGVIGLGLLASIIVIIGNTPVPFLQGVSEALEKWLFPLVLLLLGYLILMGGTLGVYLPMIPYIIFTFGSVGWFIAVIEAMVAAPLVALGLLAPGGQHKLLGKAEQAPMMLLNVFLRPTLMIFGLMTAMLLARVVVRIIGAGFGSVVGSMGMHMGIIEGYLFLIVFAGFIVVGLNKCYTLIYWLPNKVLTWIGGQAADFGEASALGEVKGIAQTGTKAVGKEVGAGLQGSMKVGREVNAAVDQVAQASSGGGAGGSGSMPGFSAGGGGETKGGGGGGAGGGAPPAGGGPQAPGGPPSDDASQKKGAAGSNVSSGSGGTPPAPT